MTRFRALGVVLAVLVVLSYSTWTLAFLSPYDHPLAGYASELAAADQPYGWLFQSGDVIAGSLMIIIAVIGRKGWVPRFGRKSRWMAAALALAGIATILDVVFNLPCSPTFNPECAADYQANPMAPKYLLHSVASVLVTVGAVSAIAFAAFGLRSRGTVREFRAVLALAIVVLTTSLSAWIIEITRGSGHGYIQVVQIALLSLWLAFLAYQGVIGRFERREEHRGR